MFFEAALSPNPAETLTELVRQSPVVRVVVVTAAPEEELTLESCAGGVRTRCSLAGDLAGDAGRMPPQSRTRGSLVG